MSVTDSITPAGAGRDWVLYRVFHQCWLQRQLFIKLLRRDFAERYRGSYLGLLWSILLPLLSLLVFTFFFGVIFQMRWAGRSDASLGDLALILFVGMALYNFLAECLSRAPGLILAHQNYVKSVVFPLEMLPVVMVASALLTLIATLLVILLLQATLGSGLSRTALLLPVMVLPLVLFLLGLSGFLASLGVYIRDIQQLIVPLVQLMMFLSPVFYPVAALPEAMRPLAAVQSASAGHRTDSGNYPVRPSPGLDPVLARSGRGPAGGATGHLVVRPHSQRLRRCPLNPPSRRRMARRS